MGLTLLFSGAIFMKKTAVLCYCCLFIFVLSSCGYSKETVFSVEPFSDNVSFEINQTQVFCKLDFKSAEEISLEIQKPENLCGTLIKRENGKMSAVFQETEIDTTNISISSGNINAFEKLFEILAVLSQNEHTVNLSSLQFCVDTNFDSFTVQINRQTQKLESIECGEFVFCFS